MKRDLYSVWKDEKCEVKYRWKVQMPKGILSFCSKKLAGAFANELKAIVENK